MILAFCWFRFARGFPRVALGTFVSFRTWVSTRCSGNLCLVSHVGFHALLWENSAAWHHRGAVLQSRRLFDARSAWRWKRRYAAGSATLRHLHSLWFTRVLFVSAGLKARVQRAVLPALESELREQEELVSRGSRERARTLARRFKQSDLALPIGGWSNQSVGMGRSPTHVQAFCPRYTLWRKLHFYPCIKTLTRFTHL